MKKAVIIGAGPAGLTAAYELLKKTDEYEVMILEESKEIGGISKTVNYKGNRMDMGGHRFFSKVDEVNDWWENILPMQGKPSKDDLIINRKPELKRQGPDPEREDGVMLLRRRVSRILFDNSFYDYPISLKAETFKNMGLKNTFLVGMSYLYSLIHKLPEDNLENFYINRFGRRLYSMFFEYYTENLWGRHPSEIDASWGAQRVKGLSVLAVLKNVFLKAKNKGKKEVETSLIEEFKYPKLGPGQLWERVAEEIKKMGGSIIMDSKVSSFKLEEGVIKEVIYQSEGEEKSLTADIVISSMPIKDLVTGLDNVPEDIKRVAKGLPYRDYMTLGVLVKKLKLKNKTKLKTIGNIVPDCWIYVQDRNVRLGRIQIYNNWSPYMVKDLYESLWLGLEYFVNEGDEFWNMTEAEFSEFAINEMIKLGLIDSKAEVLDFHMEKVKKAYPAYFDTYDEFYKVKDYLMGIDNLYPVGRNGQHRYNNIDHSMLTSFEAVKCIMSGSKDKEAVWSVNTESEYHEDKKN
ncbi:MAG: NAD(P)/FAD-dependent oxidoreductase [Lachnospiraceae bacterium]|nr:NAD(P)/FAD-dependent oxidoreductase [Lachnospiraceae bacterium]